MPFHTLAYALFLPAAAALFYLTPPAQRWATMVVGGAAFLCFVSPTHFLIAAVMTVVNYSAALAIERWAETRRGSVALWVALAVDISALVVFKYRASTVLLPLGLSYYTFQLVGYLLEVHWGRAEAERHIGRFAATILFFPKLMAGPIERPHHLLAQLGKRSEDPAGDVAAGVRQLGWGLFKKCVVADRAAIVVDAVYGNLHSYEGLALWLVIALYAIQVYADFSGYTDMALGSARIMGLRLSPNFDRPFSARSLSEFWRRWHISLSSWTNDYVFKPLSAFIVIRTRWRRAGVAFSIVVAFAVLGLWHGATWNFFAFGLIHGVAVALETIWGARVAAAPAASGSLRGRMANGGTVVFYALSCVFFRATSLRDAAYVLVHAFYLRAPGSSLARLDAMRLHIAVLALVLAAIALLRARSFERVWQRRAICYAVGAAILLLGIFHVNQFVYLRF